MTKVYSGSQSGLITAALINPKWTGNRHRVIRGRAWTCSPCRIPAHIPHHRRRGTEQGDPSYKTLTPPPPALSPQNSQIRNARTTARERERVRPPTPDDMAVASAWAKPGSWALAAEEQDDLLPPPPPVPAADFPSLATAATTKVPKKKKPQPVPLGEFNSTKFVAPAYRGPTQDDLLSLPTGPRERTAEELANATRGFGARWGGAGAGGPRGDDEPRRGGSGPQDFGPSRADEADDWGAGKKPLERRERMGGFGVDSSMSRADDVDDWVSTKRAAAPAPMERRERSVAFGADSHSRADDSASWISNKGYSAAPPPPSDSRRGGPVWGFNRDGGPDADSWERRREEVSGGGSSGGARPRLNLQKRTLPLANGTDGEGKEDKEEEKGEMQPKSRSSNPFGAARPREVVLATKGDDGRKEEEKEKEEEKLEIQPRTRTSNPFGAARPREEVLAAKGEDWRKIDEKLEAMKMREAPPPERRSFGRRGSPVRGEDNGSRPLPESHVEGAWKKPDAVQAVGESEDGSDKLNTAEAARKFEEGFDN